MDVIDRNLRLLPSKYQAVLKERLIGIYFIKNWIGSGAADYVLGPEEQVYTILVINPETLKRNASDWSTYRELTCFSDEKSQELTVRIECGTVYSGLTLLLLHETSHIVDYIEHRTPYVEDNMRVLKLAVPETPFSSTVWKDYYNPKEPYDFPQRPRITFYGVGGGPRLSLSDAGAIYRSLSRTPFVSLYGSRNWAEDFAEYCAWYFFTKKLHQPYRIDVVASGQVVYSYEPMDAAQVAERALALDGLFD